MAVLTPPAHGPYSAMNQQEHQRSTCDCSDRPADVKPYRIDAMTAHRRVQSPRESCERAALVDLEFFQGVSRALKVALCFCRRKKIPKMAFKFCRLKFNARLNKHRSVDHVFTLLSARGPLSLPTNKSVLLSCCC